MKLINSLLIVTLASATSLAQNPLQNPAISAAHNAAHTASQPNAPAKTPAASTKPSTPASTAAKAKADAPAKGAATMAKAPAHETKAPAVKEVAKEKPVAAEKKATPFTPKKTVTAKAVDKKAPEKVAKPAAAKEEESASRVTATHAVNKRDPFVSPIVRASGGGPVCETGKRCLIVDQITLRGIVKAPSGYIAVVENAARRAYFLRENDPVFNGSVVKITGDTVVFREQTMDKLGKQGTREVVKKVNAPVV